jgi:hypothetical protein
MFTFYTIFKYIWTSMSMFKPPSIWSENWILSSRPTVHEKNYAEDGEIKRAKGENRTRDKISQFLLKFIVVTPAKIKQN